MTEYNLIEYDIHSFVYKSLLNKSIFIQIDRKDNICRIVQLGLDFDSVKDIKISLRLLNILLTNESAIGVKKIINYYSVDDWKDIKDITTWKIIKDIDNIYYYDVECPINEALNNFGKSFGIDNMLEFIEK